jgi:hypothetical protein
VTWSPAGTLQQVEALIDGIVAPQGSIGPVEFSNGTSVLSSLPLPAHCINQAPAVPGGVHSEYHHQGDDHD